MKPSDLMLIGIVLLVVTMFIVYMLSLYISFFQVIMAFFIIGVGVAFFYISTSKKSIRHHKYITGMDEAIESAKDFWCGCDGKHITGINPGCKLDIMSSDVLGSPAGYKAYFDRDKKHPFYGFIFKKADDGQRVVIVVERTENAFDIAKFKCLADTEDIVDPFSILVTKANMRSPVADPYIEVIPKGYGSREERIPPQTQINIGDKERDKEIKDIIESKKSDKI